MSIVIGICILVFILYKTLNSDKVTGNTILKHCCPGK
jgi:hypothetical protein